MTKIAEKDSGSGPEVIFKEDVLKVFVKLQEKHLFESIF